MPGQIMKVFAVHHAQARELGVLRPRIMGTRAAAPGRSAASEPDELYSVHAKIVAPQLHHRERHLARRGSASPTASEARRRRHVAALGQLSIACSLENRLTSKALHGHGFRRLQGVNEPSYTASSWALT
jgi:hypothetical protein